MGDKEPRPYCRGGEWEAERIVATGTAGTAEPRLGEGFENGLVIPDAAAVFRRADVGTGQTAGYGCGGIGRQDVFHQSKVNLS